jgi:hypothetical protein
MMLLGFKPIGELDVAHAIAMRTEAFTSFLELKPLTSVESVRPRCRQR